jgi:hypothetical protein
MVGVAAHDAPVWYYVSYANGRIAHIYGKRQFRSLTLAFVPRVL